MVLNNQSKRYPQSTPTVEEYNEVVWPDLNAETMAQGMKKMANAGISASAALLNFGISITEMSKAVLYISPTELEANSKEIMGELMK